MVNIVILQKNSGNCFKCDQVSKMIENYSQTDDENADSSSNEDEDSVNENELIRPRISQTTNVSSSRNILSRLTSAHIRQFVSPDFKQDTLNTINFQAAISRPQTGKSSFRSDIRTNEIKIRKNFTKDRESITFSQRSSSSRDSRSKGKMKKSILERLCTPTFSFSLKTKKYEDNAALKRKILADSENQKSCDQCSKKNKDK